MSTSSILERVRSLGVDAYEEFAGIELAACLGELLRHEEAELRGLACALLERAVEEACFAEEGCYDMGEAAWLYDYVEGVLGCGECLRRCLADEVAFVRRCAAAAMGALAWAATAGLIRGPAYAERRAASRELCLDAADSLWQLRGDSDASTRAAVVTAIGRYAPLRTSEGALEEALGDGAERVRLAAIEALFEHAPDSCGDALARLSKDSSDAVRRAVLDALVELEHSGAIASLVERWERAEVDETLAWQTRRFFIPELTPKLRAFIVASPAFGAQHHVISALIEAGDPDCVDALRGYLGREDLAGYHALIALARIGAAEVADEVAACLPPQAGEASSRQLRCAAIYLAAHGRPAHIGALMLALELRPEEHIALFDALANLGARECLPQLRTALDRKTSARLLLALGLVGEHDDVQTLGRDTRYARWSLLAAAALDPQRFGAAQVQAWRSAPGKVTRIETFEELRLMEARVWARLAQRAREGRVSRRTREAICASGRAWVQSCVAGMPAALRCFHHRGGVISSVAGKHFLVEAELRSTLDALDALA